MIVKFKDKKGIDFNTIFPVIKEEDYNLLTGQEMSITLEELAKLKANKFLNLGGFHVDIKLIEIQEDDIKAEQSEVQTIVNKKFIFSEDIVDILFAAIESKKNVILWGKGGHGKSEISELVLDELYRRGIITEQPFIQAFGDGLTEEKLFGGMNIKKYKDEGKIEYLPENSFMNHEIVVFEEIFDAPASVLLSLKDIMTSKKFRQGTEIYNVKTKVYIGLTNKSKREFAEKDESLKALAERFALTLNVEWKSYRKHNFTKLFQTVLGNETYRKNTKKLSELANIIDMNNAEGVTFVSPRTAIAAAELFIMGKKLDYISEIDEEILAKYKKQQIEDELNPLHQDLLAKIDQYIDEYDLDTLDQSENFLKELAEMDEEIGGDPIDTSFLDDTKIIRKETKLVKAKYLLSIVDRVNPQGKLYKNFTQTKQRLNEIILIAQKEEVEPDEQAKATTVT